MAEQLSFQDYVIVSCGTLAPELNYLRKQGFLDAKRIIYTTPGLIGEFQKKRVENERI